MELLELLDEDGNPTGITQERNDDGPRQWYLTVHVWIQNSKGELLIQQRALTKKRGPGEWGISVAGYVSAGETAQQAAIREAREELGIILREEDLRFVTRIKHDRHVLFKELYHAVLDISLEDLVLQPEEVAAARWISLEDFRKELNENPAVFVRGEEEYPLLFDFLSPSPSQLSLGSWKTLSSEKKYTNQWLTLREDQVIRPDGEPGIYSVVEKHDAVMVAAFNEKEELCLVRLHRYPTGTHSWELVAGSTDGEDPLEAAGRELREETGYATDDIRLIGKFEPLSGTVNSRTHIAVARNLKLEHEHAQHEEGITDMRFFSLEEIKRMIASEELVDAPTIAAIFRIILWQARSS